MAECETRDDLHSWSLQVADGSVLESEMERDRHKPGGDCAIESTSEEARPRAANAGYGTSLASGRLVFGGCD